jgi:spore coat polysaccharide biosynthesis protein SpsF (cytidylyltransferase family)
MNLEKEARDYAFKQYGNSCGAREERVTCKEDFVSGANSKYVQIEKLKFAIDQLKPFLEWNTEVSNYTENIIQKLEKQLKELS